MTKCYHISFTRTLSIIQEPVWITYMTGVWMAHLQREETGFWFLRNETSSGYILYSSAFTSKSFRVETCGVWNFVWWQLISKNDTNRFGLLKHQVLHVNNKGTDNKPVFNIAYFSVDYKEWIQKVNNIVHMFINPNVFTSSTQQTKKIIKTILVSITDFHGIK